jgi:predicted HD phosphohydrolase
MDKIIASVAISMMEKNRGDQKRIEHSLKVFSYAQALGKLEGLNTEQQQILELTALLHDIGIHVSEQKYNSSAAHYQELEGPAVAEEILRNLSVPQHIIERVCFIISRHHTYSAIDGPEFQLLVESDFLVNAVEDKIPEKQIIRFAQNIFKSESGKYFLKLLFGLIQKVGGKWEKGEICLRSDKNFGDVPLP